MLCASGCASEARPSIQSCSIASSSTLRVADVMEGQIVVSPTGRYAVGHDSGGFFALRMVALDGDCETSCDTASNRFIEPCHGRAFDLSGMEISDAGASMTLPHLALRFAGVGPSATIEVDSYPHEISVDAARRFQPPM